MLQYLIVAGGISSSGYLDHTETFPYSRGGSWSVSSPLPQERWALRGASLGGVFHVMGVGYPYPLAAQILLSWDPATKTWAVVGSMLEKRGFHAVTVMSASSVAPYCLP